MPRLITYLYEISTTSLGLALLGLFGILSFYPMELMLMGEGQTWYWVFIILNLSVIASFFILSLIKKDNHYIIMRMLDLTLAVLLIFILIVYLTFTSDLFEPWFVQGAFFLRYNGLIMGLFLGLTAMKTITGLSFLTSNFKEREKSINSKCNEVVALLVCFSAVFFIFSILLYRYISPFYLFIMLFFMQVFLFSSSLLIFGKKNHREHQIFKVSIPVEENPIQESTRRKQGKVTSILRTSGTEPKAFRRFIIPFVIMAIFNVILCILYPLDIFIHVSFPRELDTPILQILSIISVVIMLFLITGGVFKGYISYKYGEFEQKKHPKARRSLMKFLESQKILGLLLVFSQIIYFFEFPLYFPRVVSGYLVFCIIGAILYLILARSEKYRKHLYALSILSLILNFILIYIDGMLNSQSITDASFDTFFPFLYLHSLVNLAMVGIPLGIILSDTLLNFAFKYSDGTDSVNRALFIVYSIFTFGLLVMPGNFYLNTPGGNPNLLGESTLTFFLFCVILGGILIIGFLYHLYLERSISSRSLEGLTKRKTPTKTKIKRKPAMTSTTEEKAEYKMKFVAISLCSIIVFSMVGIFTTQLVYGETHKRPIVAYSPGNYCIWLQNSSERVTNNTMISMETSPRVSSVDLNLAKNEYGAVQLVYRPLGNSINSISYELTDFVHNTLPSNKIGSGNCSLRHEGFVFEGEITDVLIPFTTIAITREQNYVFWYSLKVPYDATHGKYTGYIIFKFNDGTSQSIPISLNVWNFTIPLMKHVRTSFGRFSDSSQKISNFVYHRINDYGVELREAATHQQLVTEKEYTYWLNKSSNDWVFNWTWWDNLTSFKLNSSMNAFGLREPLGTGRDPPLENATQITWLKNWLSGVQDHLDVKDWLKYVYYYFIDEFNLNVPQGYTKQQYYDRLEGYLKIIKQAAPKIRIMTTGPPEADVERFKTYFDIYCPVSDMRDKTRWDNLLAEGKEFWYYPCVGPYAPWPNSHIYNRLYECRILMWQTWLYGIHGYLYWDSQSYYHGAYGMAYNSYGEAWFLHERNGQLLDSLRLENYLEGQEDYEYIWLLNATIKYLEKNTGILSTAVITSYRTELYGIINNIVGEEWIYTMHPSTIYSGRERIGRLLHLLSAHLNITAIGEAPWFPPNDL